MARDIDTDMIISMIPCWTVTKRMPISQGFIGLLKKRNIIYTTSSVALSLDSSKLRREITRWAQEESLQQWALPVIEGYKKVAPGSAICDISIVSGSWGMLMVKRYLNLPQHLMMMVANLGTITSMKLLCLLFSTYIVVHLTIPTSHKQSNGYQKEIK